MPAGPEEPGRLARLNWYFSFAQAVWPIAMLVGFIAYVAWLGAERVFDASLDPAMRFMIALAVGGVALALAASARTILWNMLGWSDARAPIEQALDDLDDEDGRFSYVPFPVSGMLLGQFVLLSLFALCLSYFFLIDSIGVGAIFNAPLAAICGWLLCTWAYMRIEVDFKAREVRINRLYLWVLPVETALPFADLESVEVQVRGKRVVRTAIALVRRDAPDDPVVLFESQKTPREETTDHPQDMLQLAEALARKIGIPCRVRAEPTPASGRNFT